MLPSMGNRFSQETVGGAGGGSMFAPAPGSQMVHAGTFNMGGRLPSAPPLRSQPPVSSGGAPPPVSQPVSSPPISGGPTLPSRGMGDGGGLPGRARMVL